MSQAIVHQPSCKAALVIAVMDLRNIGQFTTCQMHERRQAEPSRSPSCKPARFGRPYTRDYGERRPMIFSIDCSMEITPQLQQAKEWHPSILKCTSTYSVNVDIADSIVIVPRRIAQGEDMQFN